MPSRSTTSAPKRSTKAQAQANSSGETMAEANSAVRVLRKYPNRRLYCTRSSSYITLADVKQMVLAQEAFEVREAKSGEDLTRSILLQIILEEESGGVPLFSTPMLEQLIRVYGHTMQGLMGGLLEKNLALFTQVQGQVMGSVGQNLEQMSQLANAPLGADAWSQWLGGLGAQAPAMQGWMNGYLEQSKSMFEQMSRTAMGAGISPFGKPKA